MVDAQGRLYNGDELLYVMVADRLAQGQAVPGVVGTLMTNMAVELALRQRDIPLVRAKVGDRYVLEELAARGWQLGGEGSGHLLVLDSHTTGDGIVSALQVHAGGAAAAAAAWPNCCARWCCSRRRCSTCAWPRAWTGGATPAWRRRRTRSRASWATRAGC